MNTIDCTSFSDFSELKTLIEQVARIRDSINSINLRKKQIESTLKLLASIDGHSKSSSLID